MDVVFYLFPSFFKGKRKEEEIDTTSKPVETTWNEDTILRFHHSDSFTGINLQHKGIKNCAVVNDRGNQWKMNRESCFLVPGGLVHWLQVICLGHEGPMLKSSRETSDNTLSSINLGG
jgi:hypothetical protein